MTSTPPVVTRLPGTGDTRGTTTTTTSSSSSSNNTTFVTSTNQHQKQRQKTNTNNNSKSKKFDNKMKQTGQNWLLAIQESTAVCLDKNGGSASGSDSSKSSKQRSSSSSSRSTLDDELKVLDHSLKYQQNLSHLLLTTTASASTSTTDNTDTNKDTKTTTKTTTKNSKTSASSSSSRSSSSKNNNKKTQKKKSSEKKGVSTSTVNNIDLSTLLLSSSLSLDSLPRMDPPKFRPLVLRSKSRNRREDEDNNKNNKKGRKKFQSNKGGGKNNSNKWSSSSNKYASIMVDDDDDDDDEVEEEVEEEKNVEEEKKDDDDVFGDEDQREIRTEVQSKTTLTTLPVVTTLHEEEKGSEKEVGTLLVSGGDRGGASTSHPVTMKPTNNNSSNAVVEELSPPPIVATAAAAAAAAAGGGGTAASAATSTDTWNMFDGYGYDEETGEYWPIQSSLVGNPYGSASASAAAAVAADTSFYSSGQEDESTMDVLRILMRLYSCQSDLLTRKAQILSQRKKWIEGVVTLQESIKLLNEAMDLADSEISKHEQETYTAELAAAVGAGTGAGSSGGGGRTAVMPDGSFSSYGNFFPNVINPSKQRLWDLRYDVDAFHVASMAVVKGKDMYTKSAKKQKERLEKTIQENLLAREAARRAMGEERWLNNNGDKKYVKSPHAIEREAKQEELENVNKALEQLAVLEDVSAMEETIMSHKERTVSRYNSTMFSSSMFQGYGYGQSGEQLHSLGDIFQGCDYGSTNGMQIIDHSRYNNLRPSLSAASFRITGYPDAQDFGWLYTGCDESKCVEFFEKQFVQEEVDANGIPGNIALPTVKLDWFYMTGNCTVIMHHPFNGLTYLFTSNEGISPELYVEVLENPRDHHRLRSLYHNEHKNSWQQQVQQGSSPPKAETKKKKKKKSKTKSQTGKF